MSILQSPSPNHDERQLPINMLLLHYTGMKTGEEALQRLCDPTAKVSAHYLVEEDGRIFQLVEESRRAWHGGVGYWRETTDINSASIGVEIVNPGHEWGYRPFPAIQMEAVTELCQDILARHEIPAQNVIGHSDIAPDRKEDPGELFDWQTLAQKGIGLHPSPRAQQIRGKIIHKDHTPRDDLAQYGYTTDNLKKTILAFQRHFRPAILDGVWDEECAALLASLLKQV